MAIVPLPLDVLVGAYFPWADNFWGYVAGVPYKNIAISDSFSSLLPWRIVAMESFRNWQWPLWNPYSFSGHPLLANWQTAAFNPLNILMLLFGDIVGFGLIVFLQPILAFLFMYLFLRSINISKSGGLIGAVSFALGGFMMTHLTYATSSFIFGLTPLGLLLVNKFVKTSKQRYLLGLAILTFLILVGGFFQPALYSLLAIGLYAFWETFKSKRKYFLLISIYFWILLGVVLSAIQLLPTSELLSLSIRNQDHNIYEYNFGLLPVKNLFTFIAPDIFGNPATDNFFGKMPYQESSGYFGIVTFALAILGLTKLKQNRRYLFFAVIFFTSLTLAFENPISKIIYDLKVPLLSTGYASRWLLLTSFSGSVLAAWGYDSSDRKRKLKFLLVMLVTLGFVYLWTKSGPLIGEQVNTARRNLILPSILVLSSLVIFSMPKKLYGILICFIILLDMGRYTLKFTPLVDSNYGTKQVEFLTRMKERSGIYRIFSEDGIMPANTWTYPRLYSAGGYDPLLYKDYGVWFRVLGTPYSPNQPVDGSLKSYWMTRYLNSYNLNSPLLDLAGVKYLLTLKRDRYGKQRSVGEIRKDLPEKYFLIDESGATAALENKTVMPRVKLFYQAETEIDDTKAIEKLVSGFDFRNKLLLKANSTNFKFDINDAVAVTKYSANNVDINASTKQGAYLFLSDTDYPGWHVSINGDKSEIIRADGIFRAVLLPPGDVSVKFWYYPDSFKNGLATSAGAVVAIALLTLYSVKNKKF